MSRIHYIYYNMSSADSYGHREVVVKIHKNKSVLGGSFLFMNFHNYLMKAV